MTPEPELANSAPRILRTFWLPIVAVAALTVGAALAYVTTQEQVYVATGSVLVNADRQGGSPVLPQMGTERTIAASAEVAELASESLDVPPTAAARRLDVAVPVDANVLELSYAAPTAEEAQEGARAFTEAYVDYRNRDHRRPLVQVIAEPDRPLSPEPPDYVVPVGLALMAGLGLGFVACLGWDRLRGRLRGPGDAGRVTGLEVLASVPATSAAGRPFDDPPPPALGHLAARLCTLLGDRRSRVSVLVTTPRRGGGSTTVATYLAIALADVGREVVLVSGGLPRPDLHRALGLRRGPGMAELVRGAAGVAEVVQFTPRPNLRVITAGDTAPARHVDVDDFRGALWQIARDAVVVVDGAPVLEVPETVLVADTCDLSVLVLDVRTGRRTDAVEAVARLRRTRGSLAGLVANRPRRRSRAANVAPPVDAVEALSGPPTERRPGQAVSAHEPTQREVEDRVASDRAT